MIRNILKYFALKNIESLRMRTASIVNNKLLRRLNRLTRTILYEHGDNPLQTIFITVQYYIIQLFSIRVKQHIILAILGFRSG